MKVSFESKTISQTATQAITIDWELSIVAIIKTLMQLTFNYELWIFSTSSGTIKKILTCTIPNCAVLQYPGVAESINSDINNLVALLKVWQILPPGKMCFAIWLELPLTQDQHTIVNAVLKSATLIYVYTHYPYYADLSTLGNAVASCR